MRKSSRAQDSGGGGGWHSGMVRIKEKNRYRGGNDQVGPIAMREVPLIVGDGLAILGTWK